MSGGRAAVGVDVVVRALSRRGTDPDGTPSRLRRLIDPEEAELVEDLLDQANRLNMRSSIGSPPTILLVVATLWSHAPRQGLLIWAACTLATATVHIVLHHLHRHRSDRHGVRFWRRWYTATLLVTGTLWGSLPVLTMPSDEHREFQALVVVHLISFMAANTIFTSPLRRLFLAFQLPLATLGAVGLAAHGTTFTSMLAAFVLFALVFSLVLYDQSNRAAVDAMRLTHRNSNLVDELRAERERIHEANVELRGMNERLAHQAAHDALTDLANRPLFQTRLQESLDAARRRRGLVAVLFIDVDRFKLINDSLGHHVGDELLIAVAARLRGCLRPGDLLGRQGGDEFTVLLTGLSGVDDAIQVAQSIRASLRAPLQVGSRELIVTVSIGCATNGHPHDRADDLLRHADSAMYRAKALGRNCIEVFDESMREALVRRVDDETELRRALTGGEIVAWYQPEVDLATGRIVGAESLARWIHPRLGVRNAGEFVPLAEDAGMLHDLSVVMHRQASMAVAALRETVPSGFRIRVNISGTQIMDLGRLNGWLTQLELRGLPPTMLSLEVTETALIQDIAAARAWLTTARSVGMHVSLDDFGTGYSSLALVPQLPLDGLKIDLGFVRELTTSRAARAVVAATVELAAGLDLVVVAEGVETAEQAAALRKIGVHRAQGFLFAPAVPLTTLTGWLTSSPPWAEARATPALDLLSPMGTP